MPFTGGNDKRFFERKLRNFVGIVRKGLMKENLEAAVSTADDSGLSAMRMEEVKDHQHSWWLEEAPLKGAFFAVLSNICTARLIKICVSWHSLSSTNAV